MNEEADRVRIQTVRGMHDIPGAAWDAMVRNDYPFLKHAFLHALEQHGCVGESVGWVPRHLCCYAGDSLIAAMPLYEKYNSWGEFVFDHAWAEAYRHFGIEYYPKLLNAIPFTPATGQRILTASGGTGRDTGILLAAMRMLLDRGRYSGLHCLFPDRQDMARLGDGEAVTRTDCQFHWHNHGYRSFDEFLASLKSRKRKKIRRERRVAAESGMAVRRLDGHTASDRDWQAFTRVYRKIYDRKYGLPAFNSRFFQAVARAMPDQILLFLAEVQGKVVAGALMYQDGTTLYGRHWGCDRYVDSLHFELCYYQGIEHCIRRGLARFDPGAQGEHKIARGFEPTQTYSLHWMAQGPLSQAIRQYVKREQTGVEHYLDRLQDHIPYSQAR